MVIKHESVQPCSMVWQSARVKERQRSQKERLNEENSTKSRADQFLEAHEDQTESDDGESSVGEPDGIWGTEMDDTTMPSTTDPNREDFETKEDKKKRLQLENLEAQRDAEMNMLEDLGETTSERLKFLKEKIRTAARPMERQDILNRASISLKISNL